MNTVKIYCATNKTNGKIYIGQTSKSISRRINGHIYSAKSGKYKFANAIKKHGINNFHFDVINEVNSKDADKIETLYINLFDSSNDAIGYNTLSNGGSLRGFNHSIESRIKMSLSHKNERPGRQREIVVFDENLNKLAITKGQKNTAKLYNVSRTSLDNNLNNRSQYIRTSIGKLKFMYNN